jgi:hypothetical protein
MGPVKGLRKVNWTVVAESKLNPVLSKLKACAGTADTARAAAAQVPASNVFFMEFLLDKYWCKKNVRGTTQNRLSIF